jgi:hypothetical protein
MTADDLPLIDSQFDPKRGAVLQIIGLDNTSNGSAWFEWTLTRPGRPIKITIQPTTAFIVDASIGGVSFATSLPDNCGQLLFGPKILPKGSTLRITVKAAPGTVIHAELHLEYLTD